MNEWDKLHRQADRYKAEYPSGTRIMLLSMGQDIHRVSDNTRGTVMAVDDIGTLLNQVIVNPELVQVPAEPEHEPSMQVRKVENEIARTLDTLNYDKDILRQKMLECVSLKYADIDSAPYTAHRLKAAPHLLEPLSTYVLYMERNRCPHILERHIPAFSVVEYLYRN